MYLRFADSVRAKFVWNLDTFLINVKLYLYIWKKINMSIIHAISGNDGLLIFCIEIESVDI